MNNNILIYTDNTFMFGHDLNDKFNIHVAHSEIELFQLLNEHFFQLIIMSDRYILGGATYGHKALIDHPIFYDMPIIAYTQNSSVDIATKLYSLNIKGIVDSKISTDDLLIRINEILSRSNPYIGRLRDRFIKVFIKYEDAEDMISNILYLTNYLIWYYKIDQEKAADIRISVVFLAIAFTKKRLHKITQLVHNMDISPYLDNMMQNYQTPQSLDENIVFASIIFGNFDTDDNFTIDTKKIDKDVLRVADDAMQKSKIFISCSHDIYNFWERFSQFSLQNEAKIPLKYCDIYLHYIFKILYRALVGHNSLEAELDHSDDRYFKIIITPKDCTSKEIQECIQEVGNGDENVQFEEYDHNSKVSLLIKLNNTPHSSTTIAPVKRTVDISKLNSMHYKDETKISALAFLDDFNVDNDMLDNLVDNERDAKNFLYFKEELTQEMIEAVSVALTRYTHLLNETIEFEDLAYSIGALTEVISNMILASLDDEVKVTLKLYITGIITDLSSWREHIFVLADTPDIHYLDASLLDNCSEIEALIHPNSVNTTEDEDDLEFF